MLGNTDFVNARHPEGTSPLLHAVQKGLLGAMLSMMQAGARPEKQGSDWLEFFMAVTRTFTEDMAKTIHSMLSKTSLLQVSQHGWATVCCSPFAVEVQWVWIKFI